MADNLRKMSEAKRKAVRKKDKDRLKRFKRLVLTSKGRQAQETAETMRPMPRPKRMFERQQDAYDAAMEIYEKNMEKFNKANQLKP